MAYMRGRPEKRQQQYCRMINHPFSKTDDAAENSIVLGSIAGRRREVSSKDKHASLKVLLGARTASRRMHIRNRIDLGWLDTGKSVCVLSIKRPKETLSILRHVRAIPLRW